MPFHYEHRYTVEGNGEFPIDMLRYDHSAPFDEADSYAIMRAHQRFSETKEAVNLVRYSINLHWKPNADRWRSYGWAVTLLTKPTKRTA